MTEPTDPALAQARRALIAEMSEVEFRQWRHHPISAAFFQYMEDQSAAFRETAADLLENGLFTPGAREETKNPDVLRGHMLAFRQLRRITVAELRDFYGHPGPQSDETDTDEPT